MANIDNVQLPDGSSYNIVDNTSGFATQNYVDSAVSSVTKTTIGLGNVDNTSDLNKPISSATQTALNTLDEDKADKTDIATVESGTTASRPISIGTFFYLNGTLVRAIVDIANGATFTINTNYEIVGTGALNELNESRCIVEIDTPTSEQLYTKSLPNKYSGAYSYIVGLEWYNSGNGVWYATPDGIGVAFISGMGNNRQITVSSKINYATKIRAVIANVSKYFILN